MKEKIVEVNVRKGTNEVLQKAIDTVFRSGGGKVLIGPGTFMMYDSLHLKSGVKVVGTQGKTILKKSSCVSSPLSADLGYGHYDVSVEKPHLFKPGMGIYIKDDSGRGFYGTVATITWKKDDRLGISKMLNHDYARIRNAIVSTVFPVISGYYVKSASIQHIVIDGNKDENIFIDGCRGGGIFLLQCHNINLSNIIVRNYNGDGISYQQCTKILIDGCEIKNNSGSGLHPGSGSAGTIMRNCKINNNDKDGVFYCLRVSFTLLENCKITMNGNDGISIGARDTDHIIQKNIISSNGRFGIYFRKADEAMGGHRNFIVENTVSENCIKEGNAEIFIENINNDIWFKANKIRCGKDSKYGIIAGDGCKRIHISDDNCFSGCKVKVKNKNFKRNIPENICVGPQYLTRESLRHLNIIEEL